MSCTVPSPSNARCPLENFRARGLPPPGTPTLSSTFRGPETPAGRLYVPEPKNLLRSNEPKATSSVPRRNSAAIEHANPRGVLDQRGDILAIDAHGLTTANSCLH